MEICSCLLRTRSDRQQVIGLIDIDGNQVVEYKYDSWGNTVSITGTLADTVGVQNPFRYRGYYLDAETGLYYVGSRYYDPELGRFISSDTIAILDVQSDLYNQNLYAYCDNNPVIRMDKNGNLWELAMVGGGILGTGVGGSVATIGNSIAAAVGTITPFGWIAIGVVVVVSLTTAKVLVSKKSENKEEKKERSEYPPALRKRYSTRKQALDAAKKAGHGKPPKKHKDSISGKHFHPNVENKHKVTPKRTTVHDHYIYPSRY